MTLPDLSEPPAPPQRPRRTRRRIRRWVGLGVVVLLAGAVLAAAPWDPQRRQAYADQFVVWTEPPSESIEQLAEELTLTETGRRIFFASRPRIEDASDFQEHCTVEAGIVLGCYYRWQIYVYEVTDERLAGTIEATAAHELLHAVYARMSDEEQARIDALVAQVVATLPETDSDVQAVAGYPESQWADEWHSRLGTSHTGLPAELEAHYAEIFADRAQVLAYATEATEQLDEYAERIAQLSAELDAAAADLEARSAAYDAALAALNADIEDFNARADAGSFPSQSAFDAERESLLARQDALESERLALNADVDAYNAKLAELQSLDAERAELYSHLDSRAAPDS
ncbi:MAG: hypothetical protein QM675_09245 [Protaetiibacter sp.]